MKIIITILLILNFSIHSFGQDSLNWKLYEVETGIINYKISVHELNNGKLKKKQTESILVKISFSNYGEKMIIEWQTPGQKQTKILKIKDKQHHFLNDSIIERKPRQYDFDVEKIIMNNNYHCKECIITTAKPLQVKFLSLDCLKNLMFYSKDLPNRGTLISYKGIPLEIKFKRENESVLLISADSIDFSVNKEIEELTTIANRLESSASKH